MFKSFYEIDSAITTPVNIFECHAASDFLDSQLRAEVDYVKTGIKVTSVDNLEFTNV